jgi:hypothetical protein
MTTIFEGIAARAYEILAIEKLTDNPRAAWRMAAPAFTASKASQEKPCPIDTFCGLWYAAKIKGSVRWKNYQLGPDAGHAIDGITELQKNSNLSKREVWDRVAGTETYNGQMDVLFLFGKGV